MYDKKILVLEPYFGGSHRNFLAGLKSHLPFSFDFVTLPARKWKWRMRFSAPYFAELLPERAEYDAILCSTFVDVATLRGLAPSWINTIPIVTYFHENQFAYPVQVNDERDFHFALTNFTTALASDRLAFNSSYNLETFLRGCATICKKSPDMKLDMVEHLRKKSVVLYPGVDFGDLDCLAGDYETLNSPTLIWNHRWEHDKNPEQFFQALFELDKRGVPFNLVVLGQSFKRQPEIFNIVRQKLDKRILHFGYVTDKMEYLRWLKKGTVVVSTASHEFYGISVIEAVRAGCRPLLPDRLSYPELFPDDFLYKDKDFIEMLQKCLAEKRLEPEYAAKLTEKFSWSQLSGRYKEWLLG